MKGITTFSVLLTCLLFISCKREQPQQVSGCQDFGPRIGIGFGPFWWYVDTLYQEPAFSRANPDEFVYYKKIGKDHERVMMKHNLATGESVFLRKGRFSGQAEWTKRNEIIFSEENGIISKLSADDGKEEVILIEPGGYQLAVNPDGFKFIYKPFKTQGVSAYVSDINGNLLDSFTADTAGNRKRNYDFGHWYDDDKVATRIPGGAGYTDIDNHQSVILFWGEIHQPFRVCALRYKRQLLFIQEGSIYKVNMVTQETLLFKEGCDTKHYRSLSVSPDEKWLLVEREHCGNPASDYILCESRIYRIDIETGFEQEVRFD